MHCPEAKRACRLDVSAASYVAKTPRTLACLSRGWPPHGSKGCFKGERRDVQTCLRQIDSSKGSSIVTSSAPSSITMSTSNSSSGLSQSSSPPNPGEAHPLTSTAHGLSHGVIAAIAVLAAVVVALLAGGSILYYRRKSIARKIVNLGPQPTGEL